MLKVHSTLESYVASRHLQLWIYGHIIEASEPYELLANLLAIALGETFKTNRFPPHSNGRPQSPGSKIDKLEQSAAAAGLPQITVPLREVWDRDFRNAIFHSDYSVHGSFLCILESEAYRQMAILNPWFEGLRTSGIHFLFL